MAEEDVPNTTESKRRGDAASPPAVEVPPEDLPADPYFTGIRHGIFNQFKTSRRHYFQTFTSDPLILMKWAIEGYFSEDVLWGVTRYGGILVGSRQTPSDPRQATYGPVQEAALKAVKSDFIYKVYIAELDPRGAPSSPDDPKIGTYQDMYVAPNVVGVDLTKGGHLKKIEEPARVDIQYYNFANLEIPLIIEVKGRPPIPIGVPTSARNDYQAGLASNFTPGPNNPNVRIDDQGPLIGLGRYSSGGRNAGLLQLDKAMLANGITNRYTRIAIAAVCAKESGLIPQSEKGWANASIERTRKFFGRRVSEFNDQELEALKQNDKEWFSHIYGPKFFGPGTAASWANHTGRYDGYNYRGRGFNQITFKATYKKYGNLIGKDLVANPDLLNSSAFAAPVAAVFILNRLKKKFPNPNLFTSQTEANVSIAHANAGWGKDIGSDSVTRAINATNKASFNFE